MSQITIDIIIPSYRLDEYYLVPILSIPVPADVNVSFFLICDNPELSVPESILKLGVIRSDFQIIINETNLGFSATRNKGIDLTTADWILFLDDDVKPDKELLFAYRDAIRQHPYAIGFAGVTNFPESINTITEALVQNGFSAHFCKASVRNTVSWSPTANMLLNRKKLGVKRFLLSLNKSSEDIEFLSRNSRAQRHEKYLSVPAAQVVHPWWDGGKPQLRRMFRYGQGQSDIMTLAEMQPYIYYDFPTTVEMIATAFIVFTAVNLVGYPGVTFFVAVIGVLCISEFLTNLVRQYTQTKHLSLHVAFHMFTHKNAMGIGRFKENMTKWRLRNFFRVLDGSFSERKHGHFRLNRWKIVKLFITGIIGLCTIAVYQASA